MFKIGLVLSFCLITGISQVPAQSVRGAFPSPSIQILPLMVATERARSVSQFGAGSGERNMLPLTSDRASHTVLQRGPDGAVAF